MSKIILADGTELQSDFLYPMTATQLTGTVYGLGLPTVAVLLDNQPQRTAFIRFVGENDYDAGYSGYTRLAFVTNEGEHVRFALEKEA